MCLTGVDAHENVAFRWIVGTAGTGCSPWGGGGASLVSVRFNRDVGSRLSELRLRRANLETS